VDSVSEAAADERQALDEGAGTVAAAVEEDESFRRALGLAHLVQEIVSQGEDEFEACQSVLGAFAEYLRLRPRPAGAFGGER
jgi:hypothetical protein